MRLTPTPSHAPALSYGMAMFMLLMIQGSVCYGQTQTESENARHNRNRIENKFQGATTQRTSDMLSLATITPSLRSRVSRLERMLRFSNPYTAVGVKEAKASLRLALAERDEFLKRPSKPSEVEIAAAELSVARAESQLTITLATQKERMLLCQIDVVDAELRLLQMSKKIELQQRLIARGLSTAETFAQEKMALSAAEKQLELMRLRRETQRILQGVSDTQPEGDPKQPSRSSTTP